jgi:8-oxo-dGTP pyrophosphatase MutT (NUDIX family)
VTTPRVFVGSSRESLPLARGVKANLEEIAEVRVWDEDLFVPGNFQFEDLLGFTQAFDFAVFILAGDDLTLSRGAAVASPRDNVMLEAGVFYGGLGRERVILVAPREDAVKTPTDLQGITIARFSAPSDQNYRAATSSACSSIAKRISALGPLQPLAQVGSVKPTLYSNFAVASAAMVAACRSTASISVMCNKGLAFFGLDESVISMADAESYSALQTIRLLVLDPTCSWISESAAALRRYESMENYRRNLTASHAVLEVGVHRLAQLCPWVTTEIRYHSVQPCFRLLMTDDSVFLASYADEPSNQVRDLPVLRFDRGTGSLYHAFERMFQSSWNSSEPASPAPLPSIEVSAGGILLTRDEDRTLVALVERADGTWALPKGHRADREEDLRETARREVCEELGLVAQDIVVGRPLDDYTYDESVQPSRATKVIYLFVMELVLGGCPKLQADAVHRSARWWRVDEPLPRLRYAYQRTLLAEVLEQELGVVPSFVA